MASEATCLERNDTTVLVERSRRAGQRSAQTATLQLPHHVLHPVLAGKCQRTLCLIAPRDALGPSPSNEMNIR